MAAIAQPAFYGLRFRRQEAIGNYVVDFVCHEMALIVEVDGGQHAHARDRDHDAVRTAFLQSRGFRVLRLWNNEALSNMDGVLTQIREAATPSP